MRNIALTNHLPCLLWTALLGMALTTSVGASSDPNDAMPVEPLDCVINPSVVADLGSGVPGILNSIVVDRSDLVRVGDVVAELESSVEAAAVELAQARADMDAEVKLRRVNVGFGRRQQKRTEDLFQRKAISTNDMDERNTEARLAGIQLRQALDNQKLTQLEQQRAVHVLKRRSIKSPIDGVVMERFKTVGEYVEDQPVVRIAQLDPLYVEVFVPVEHLGKVRPGMQAEVWTETVAGKRWQAKVSRVDRVADVASGTYGVRLELPNADYAVPAGLRCQLEFLAASDLVADDPVGRPEPKTVVALPAPVTPVIPVPAVQVPPPAPSGSAPSPTPVQIAEEESPMATAVARAPASTAPVPATAQQIAAKVIPVERPAPKIAAQSAPPSEVDISIAKDAAIAVAALPLCHLVGPLETKRQARAEARLMRKNGFAVTIEHQQANVQIGHKIATKQLESYAAARNMVRNLKKAGFSDLYLPKRRKALPRVYLGLYHHERDAQRQVAKLAKKGFEAELLPWRDSVTEYFLLARKATEDSNESTPAAVAASSEKSKACEQFASR